MCFSLYIKFVIDIIHISIFFFFFFLAYVSTTVLRSVFPKLAAGDPKRTTFPLVSVT